MSLLANNICTDCGGARFHKRDCATPSQRKATAAFHDKMARAFKAHGKPKDAKAAQEAAKRCRAK